MTDKKKPSEYLSIDVANNLPGMRANTEKNWGKQDVLEPARLDMREAIPKLVERQ